MEVDDRRARQAFERLGKTDRYLVLLGLLKARTARTGAARLQAAPAEPAAGSGGMTR